MRRVVVAACVVSATAALVAPAQNPAAPAPKAVPQTIRTVARGIAAASGAPFSLAVDASGKVYVAVGNEGSAEGAQVVTDPMTNRVFVLSSNGAMKAIAGSGRSRPSRW